MHQPVHVLGDLHERAEVRYPDHLALQRAPPLEPGRGRLERVRPELLDPQRHPAGLRLHRQELDLHRRPRLVCRWRRVGLRPRQVVAVAQPLDALGHLQEDPEVRRVADDPVQHAPHGVRLGKRHQRIRQGAAARQPDPASLAIHLHNHRLHLVTHRHHVRRAHVARPTPLQLRGVDQPVDARLQLDERAEPRRPHDRASHGRARSVALLHRQPRVRGERLDAHGGLALVRIDSDEDRLDLVPDRAEVRRRTDAAPRHLRRPQQRVHAPDVQEGPEVGEPHDLASYALPLPQRLQDVPGAVDGLLLEDGPAGHHRLSLAVVQVHDPHRDGLAHDVRQVIDRGQVHLTRWEEAASAEQVHRRAATHLGDDPAGHDVARVRQRAHGVPDRQRVGLRGRAAVGLPADDQARHQDRQPVARRRVSMAGPAQVLRKHVTRQVRIDVEHRVRGPGLDHHSLHDLADRVRAVRGLGGDVVHGRSSAREATRLPAAADGVKAAVVPFWLASGRGLWTW